MTSGMGFTLFTDIIIFAEETFIAYSLNIGFSTFIAINASMGCLERSWLDVLLLEKFELFEHCRLNLFAFLKASKHLFHRINRRIGYGLRRGGLGRRWKSWLGGGSEGEGLGGGCKGGSGSSSRRIGRRSEGAFCEGILKRRNALGEEGGGFPTEGFGGRSERHGSEGFPFLFPDHEFQFFLERRVT